LVLGRGRPRIRNDGLGARQCRRRLRVHPAFPRRLCAPRRARLREPRGLDGPRRGCRGRALDLESRAAPYLRSGRRGAWVEARRHPGLGRSGATLPPALLAPLRPSGPRSAEAEEPSMRSPRLASLATWGAGPLLVLALGAALGRSRQERNPFVEATAALSEAERKQLESAPALAIANATWALGDLESV